jgi:hypothetical protein
MDVTARTLLETAVANAAKQLGVAHPTPEFVRTISLHLEFLTLEIISVRLLPSSRIFSSLLVPSPRSL